jgi:hypothetical protein
VSQEDVEVEPFVPKQLLEEARLREEAERRREEEARWREEAERRLAELKAELERLQNGEE